MDERERAPLVSDYLNRLRRQLRGVPPAVREDAVREVQAHIDDACRERGGSVVALREALERLGPPEAYGRDLGLQLMVQAARGRRSLPLLAWAVLFWASTSLLGALAALGALILYAVAIVFLLDGGVRALGLPVAIIEANGVTYPPAWPPLLNFALGAGLGGVLTGLLRRLIGAWGRSRLAARGLAVALNRETVVLPSSWERQTTLAMAAVALLGLAACSIFGALGGLFPIGYHGSMALPQDFFKNPLTALAFVGLLVFLAAPALGILWTARRNQA